jgi:hypothetical protein
MGVTTGKSAFQPNIVTNGLVLNLDAINPNSYPQSGTIWYDTSGNNNNGTLTNGTSWTPNGAQTSFSFDGVDDYVNCGNPSILNFNNQKNITVSSWIYPMGTSNSNANIITKAYQWYLNFNNDRKIRVGFYTSSNTFSTFYSNSILSLNQWYNVLWTYNGANIVLYINSIVDTTTPETSNISNGLGVNCNVLLGAEANFCGSPETRYYNGRIANTQVYNRALTAQEVLQNYNALKSRFGLT